MAREPYRTRMLQMLNEGDTHPNTPGFWNQKRLLTEFVVMEAGSSHSDVQAAIHCQSLYEEIWEKKFVPDRYYVQQLRSDGKFAVMDSTIQVFGSDYIVHEPIARFDEEEEARTTCDLLNTKDREEQPA